MAGICKRKKAIQGICKNCGEIFLSSYVRKIFCSDKCSQVFHYSKKCKIPFIEKECLVCKTKFNTRRNERKYCSKKCSKKIIAERYGRQGIFPNIPNGTVGTISELIVITDLLKKGYEAYRPLSPNCSADILVEKNTKILKIEVRTGYKGINKTIYYPNKNIKAPILAIVLLKENNIKYIDISSKQDIII